MLLLRFLIAAVTLSSRLRMFGLLLVASAVLGISTLAPFTWAQTQSQAQTQIEPPSHDYKNLLPLVISEKNCASSQHYFLGCVAALDSLAQMVRDQRVVPTFEPALITRVYDLVQVETVESYGSLTFARMTGKELHQIQEPTAETVWMPARAYQNWKDAWESVYLRGQYKTIPFSKLVGDLTSELGKLFSISEQNELTLTSLTQFAIFSAKDPHAFINSSVEADSVKDAADVNSYTISNLGLELRVGPQGIEVTQVARNSAAAVAGVYEKDLIQEINSQPVSQSNYFSAVGRIQFSPGVTLQLKLQRGEAYHQISLIPKERDLPYVESRLIQHGRFTYGVIELRTFYSDNICEMVGNQIVDRMNEANGKLDGWILDLRGNSGGRVYQAACVAHYFLQPHMLVASYGVQDLRTKTLTNMKRIFVDDGITEYLSKRKVTLTKKFPSSLPLTILIDAKTASAAEILASALRDHNRGLIVGERSFGKGVFQDDKKKRFTLGAGLVLWSTNGYILRPSGKSVHRLGISPDVLVPRNLEFSESLNRPVSREEHLIPPSIEAFSSENENPTYGGLAAIRKCSAKEGSASKRYQEALGQQFLPDLQLFKAQDVLKCMIKIR